MTPAEIDSVEVSGVAVAEPRDQRIADVDLGVLAVKPAPYLREAIRADQLVTEPLPLFLIAGNPLSDS